MWFALLEFKVILISYKTDRIVCNCWAVHADNAGDDRETHLDLVPGTKTLEPLELDKAHAFAWIEGGFWASVRKRDTTDVWSSLTNS